MALPTPNQDEESIDFMNRCMADDAMMSEFPEQNQRSAICMAMAFIASDDDDDEGGDEGDENQAEVQEEDNSDVETQEENDQNFEQNYQTDKEEFEEDLENPIGSWKGRYVKFEHNGQTLKGRIVDVAPPELQQSENHKEDPHVIVSVYDQDEEGNYTPGNMKVIHQLSKLTSIPHLKYELQTEKENDVLHERKIFAFTLQETKEVEIDGQNFGIVRGYASTYGNVDRGNDRVINGAFTKSLNQYQQTGRPIKMYYQHDNKEIIGGFPIDKIRDDANGLYVEGQINLNVQRGREAYALAKQGVIQDFSIGYTVNDYDIKAGVRELTDLTLWEISMVGEPMNTEARILSVKADEEKDTNIITFEEVKHIKDKRDFEKLLRDSGKFSKQAAIYLSSQFNANRSDSEIENELKEIKSLINFLNQGIINGSEKRRVRESN